MPWSGSRDGLRPAAEPGVLLLQPVHHPLPGGRGGVAGEHAPNGRSIRRGFTTDELSSMCPVTRQPDLAELVIEYVPDEWCVESKSLKLFLGSFRNHGAFHEDCTVTIGKRISNRIFLTYARSLSSSQRDQIILLEFDESESRSLFQQTTMRTGTFSNSPRVESEYSPSMMITGQWQHC